MNLEYTEKQSVFVAGAGTYSTTQKQVTTTRDENQRALQDSLRARCSNNLQVQWLEALARSYLTFFVK